MFFGQKESQVSCFLMGMISLVSRLYLLDG